MPTQGPQTLLTSYQGYLGPAAGVAASLLWTFPALFFTAAGKRIGTVGVNALRIGLALMFVLGGMGVGIYEAVEDTIAADLLPSEIRGSGFGVLAVVTGLGDLISSVLFGWAWAGAGIRIAASAVLIPMIAGAMLLIHLALRHQNLEEKGGRIADDRDVIKLS